MLSECSPSTRRIESPSWAMARPSSSSTNVARRRRFVESPVSHVFQMLLGMTKALKRIRAARTAEDGEVLDWSSEEEGEVHEEQGDDVATVTTGYSYFISGTLRVHERGR